MNPATLTPAEALVDVIARGFHLVTDRMIGWDGEPQPHYIEAREHAGAGPLVSVEGHTAADALDAFAAAWTEHCREVGS